MLKGIGNMQRDMGERGTERAAWRFFGMVLLFSGFFWGVAALSPQGWSTFPTVLLYILGGVGPSLVAVTLIARHSTKEDRRDFWRRVVDLRQIAPIWYLAILTIAVLPNIVARLVPVDSSVSPATAAQGPLGALILVAILAGFAEELGWRGYALDRLFRLRTALTASLIVGTVWTLWHLPLYFIGGTVQHDAGLWSQDFWFDMSARIPLAVLFTWVYVNTHRSILSAVLLHAVDNVASVTMDPEGNQMILRFTVVTGLAILVTVFWGARTLTGQTAITVPRAAHDDPLSHTDTGL